MKKYLGFIIASLLGVLLLLPGMAMPAFAASAQAAIPAMQRNVATTNGSKVWHPVRHGYYGAPQINNQYFHGNGNTGNHISAVGNNLNNTGNPGWNRRYIQDNTINAGNQLANTHPQSGYQINNQHYVGNGNVGNTFFFKGSNQGNSSNPGVNDGVIQDNNSNGGNQILN